MTARPEFGAAIAVDGVRPAWLPDDVEFEHRYRTGIWHTGEPAYRWHMVTAIRLEVPRYDFVYLALERGMVPHFGKGFPADWDEGEALLRCGDMFRPCDRESGLWVFDCGDDPDDVIGYKSHATSPALPLAHPAAPQGEDTVTVPLMTEEDVWHDWACKDRSVVGETEAHLEGWAAACRYYGLIKPALAPAAIASGREGAE